MSAQSSSATPRSTTAAETNTRSDNTSHPSVKHCADKVNARHIHGRPESELVPSRYALKVGEIDVMVISDGVLSLPSAMLGHNVNAAVRAAWLEDMFLPTDVLEWALNAVVVRSGGRTILIDAGMGMEFPDLPRSGKLAAPLLSRAPYSKLRRNSVGVRPVIRRNATLNALDPPNPTSNAISVTDLLGFASNVFARSIRRLTQYRWGGSPIDCLKDRTK